MRLYDNEAMIKVFRILRGEVKKWRAPVMDLHETHEGDPFRILVGTILSARTKDEITAEACKRLFSRVRSFEDLRRIRLSSLEKLIYPVGFYKTKARNLKKIASTVDRVPCTIEELLKLPGVGRKTANLVVHLAFRKPAICVDTHVHRITNRLGYLKTKTPEETEMVLRRNLPESLWRVINSYLVAYGQRVCTPTSPKCSVCAIRDYCARRGVSRSR